MSRIGYLSSGLTDFLDRLRNLMLLAKESLELKRKTIERFTEQGLYPYSKFYLSAVKERLGCYWTNHFSTIGLIGMNEACLNFLGEDISTERGQEFAVKVANFMRDELAKYQKETEGLFNLEATPGEGACYRLAKIDLENFPNIKVAGNDEPYYTNSTQLPVDYSGDLFDALSKQDDLQVLYTGGTVFHGFLGEKVDDPESVKLLVKRVTETFHLPYFTITPTFSICPTHGYLSGKHFQCSKCGQDTEVYSRVVGYFRPVKQWNKGKQEEFKQRKEFVLQGTTSAG
jgi:ribonucleoside-triphosphate reductase